MGERGQGIFSFSNRVPENSISEPSLFLAQSLNPRRVGSIDFLLIFDTYNIPRGALNEWNANANLQCPIILKPQCIQVFNRQENSAFFSIFQILKLEIKLKLKLLVLEISVDRIDSTKLFS